MPIEGPQGQEWEDFDSCVDSVSDWEGVTEEEAKRMCGAWEASTNAIRVNASDPTETKTKRKQFRQAFGGRWRDVRGDNRRWIGDISNLQQSGLELEYRRFFETMARNNVLEPASQTQIQQGNHWTGSWIRTAYQKGLSRAAGFLSRLDGISSEAIQEATRITRSEHQQALTQEYAKIYSTVSDHITFARSQVTDAFHRAVENSKSTRWLADQTNAIIRTEVQNRYTATANTAIVRAVNEAALTSYEILGLEEVGVAVENRGVSTNAHMRVNAAGEVIYTTAGDDKVCPECEALEGEVLKISEVRKRPDLMPPVHPNCRCFLVPAPMDLKKDDVTIEAPDSFSEVLRGPESSASR